MNKIGVYYAYWEKNWDANYPYYIQKIANLGFDVMELAVGALIDRPKNELKNMKAAADNLGVELTYCIGFPSDKDVSSPDAATRQKGIEFAKRILETISLLDGEILSGIIYGSWPGRPLENVEDKKRYWDIAVDSQKQIMKTAEQYGIVCCYEVVNRFEQFIMNTAEEGMEFIRAVGSRNAKLLLDSFHMNIEEDSLSQAIRTAGNKIGHIHIGECNRKVPGRGHMPWDDMFQALKEVNYTGRIVMEPFVKMEAGEVARDIRVYRPVEKNTDEEQLDQAIREALQFVKNKIK